MISKLFRNAVLTVVSSMSGIFLAQAQTFVPSVAHETVFNNWDINYSGDISSFAFNNTITPTAWGDVDVYLASWGFGFSEVTVQFTKPGDPTSVVYKGNLSGLQGSNNNYQDASYLQVGAVYNENTGNIQILVAYQWVGFKVDVFDITTSTTDPVVYNSTINLTSSSLNYFDHRIRMDCDSKSLNSVALVWDNPFIGLQTIACNSGTWGNILNLNNTSGQSGPDIAVTNIGGSPYVRYVYRDANGTQITSSMIDFNTLMSATGTVNHFIQDVNYLSSPLNSNLVLDCKDYDNAKNWAYTYTDQNALEVFVRFIDNNTTGTPTTVSVNTGALGNASLYGQYNVYAPTLHYGSKGSKGDEIFVGWYNTDGNHNGYLAVEMTPDGTGLISDADYLELPNAFTATPYPYVSKSGIAFCKGDADLTSNRHMYTVYYDYDNANNVNRLHHAYHLIGFTAFKDKLQMDLSQVKVYPNPFSTELNTTVTLAEKGTVRLELLDIAGRLVSQYETVVDKGTYPMQLSGLQNIVSGSYFLKTSIDGKMVQTRTVIKK
ncbi:hypothetical protein DBR32_02385 [Taibaiella sp. KBW10]|uniref:T9SS type A sorting domain-containing protein n=1 Tax=Taibaiella sp. KBW10 TaxID=2153357 RepID=UPI000F5A9F91|nr:T9SS type A sorting domain-containing protein [Taibaiella sp. KBW10]RQO32472.1 hypothetical protein DBR32_02385 [Taibaiella sp. KBW10]